MISTLLVIRFKWPQQVGGGFSRCLFPRLSGDFKALGGAPNNSRVDLKSDPQQHFVNRRRGIIQDGLMFSRSI